MFQWIEKQPVRFMGLAWFLSFVIGWLSVLLVDFVLSSFFTINAGDPSPAFSVSISLFGFTVAGFVSGLATATLIRVHKGEISQTSFNMIVFGWTLMVTLLAMLYFLINSLIFQSTNLG
jgi:hypothetical protein